MFLVFFNYLKTETRKNSEKNYTNILLDGRCSSIFRKIFYSKWCAWNHDFWSTASSAPFTNAVLLSTLSRTLLSKSDGKWLFIVFICVVYTPYIAIFLSYIALHKKKLFTTLYLMIYDFSKKKLNRKISKTWCSGKNWGKIRI